MPETFYAKGTIKVKNADEKVVSFLPTTDTSSISDDNGVSLENALETINQKIAVAENSGGIELMYEEPTAENTTGFRNETLIGYVVPEIWSFTVNTEAKTPGNAKSAIPFHFSSVYNTRITLTVDWGDGTTSNFGKGYSGSSNEQVHTYSQPGTYTINITSTDWSNTEMYTYYSSPTSNSSFFIDTLISIDKKLPKLKNTSFYDMFYHCTSLQSIPEGLFDKNTQVTGFAHCFYGCTSLQSIPEGLFDKNTAVTTFISCFELCTSLQSIPEGLFDKNTQVIDFSNCFASCTSLQSIPAGLFDNNALATNFNYCFYSCSSLRSIPSGLFDKNTAATNFFGCFFNCTSLQSIPEGLFDKNTAATNFSDCFYYCSSLTDFTLHIGSRIVSSCYSFVTSKSGTTRTIYVPSGSTTQTTFNNVASSLGLTIIGE